MGKKGQVNNPQGINQYTTGKTSGFMQLMAQKPKQRSKTGRLHPAVLQSLHDRSSGYKPSDLHPAVLKSLRDRSNRR